MQQTEINMELQFCTIKDWQDCMGDNILSLRAGSALCKWRLYCEQYNGVCVARKQILSSNIIINKAMTAIFARGRAENTSVVLEHEQNRMRQ